MRLLSSIILVVVLAGLAGPLPADDLEVYASASSLQPPPNILFVFDNSGSMNKTPLGKQPGQGNASRLNILKTAINEILSKDFDPGINVGYMNFRDRQGSGVKFPIAGIDNDAHDIDPQIPAGTTVRAVISSLVNSSKPKGDTPTVEALYEAARYFRGERLDRGRFGKFGPWDNSLSPPGYRERDWRAANPVSYTGEDLSRYEYLDPNTPIKNGVHVRTCRDYSARPNSNRNDCAAIPATSLYNCVTYGVKPCTKTTKNICVKASYPIHSSCLNGPGSSTTPWLNGNKRYCCRSADATNAECLSWKSLKHCDKWERKEVCVGGRNKNQVYTECRYRYRYIPNDTRRYQSPIGAQCQKNAIILLSDGAPSKNGVDTGAVRKDGSVASPRSIRSLIFRGVRAVAPPAERYASLNDVTCADLSNSIFNRPDGSYKWGNCGPELADFLHRYDQIPTLENSTVETYTIGFGLNGPGAAESQAYLRLLAQKGGGKFYEASNAAQLIASISSIISNISSNSQNMTGLALGVDRNRMSTAGKTYMGLFLPSNQRSWEGNIKGYFLESKGIVDINGQLAVSPDGKGFDASAQSFWSSDPDGATVIAGGLRNRLTPANRTIYVNTQDTPPSSLKLADHPELLLTTGNTSLTNTLLGLPASADATTRRELIEWARSAQMKAPLHAKPTVIHYGGDRGDVLFAMTNQGYLHAFDVTHPTAKGDTSGGDELFAFLPRALISNLAPMKTNGSTGQHIYGLDGPITVLAEDNDHDGTLVSSGDRVILYFGMRRGGNAYYAMDVSDPEDPILLWRLDPSVSGFSRLGQSWSRMVLTTILDGSDRRKVLVFGAGYDPDQDGYAGRQPDDIGAGLFVVDAYTGELIMSFGEKEDAYLRAIPDMRYSVPAEPRVVDLDGDGLADRIYFGDMGGQLWSIDFPKDGSISDANAWTVHRLADLGSDTEQHNRRFYYPPAISRVMRNGVEKLAIAIGSGYRAHPLNDRTDDFFFVLFDAIDKPADSLPETLTRDKLFDLTTDLIGPGSNAKTAKKAAADLAVKEGWFIRLPAGSKVLSEARIVGNTVMFNTFSATGSACAGVSTRNDFYLVSLLDARALVDLDEVEETIKEDRRVTLDITGIASAPGLVFTDPASNAGQAPSMDIYVGQEKVFSQTQNIYKVFWKEVN